eukprot:2300925-Pleurochrysis_carterae.AAC.3
MELRGRSFDCVRCAPNALRCYQSLCALPAAFASGGDARGQDCQVSRRQQVRARTIMLHMHAQCTPRKHKHSSIKLCRDEHVSCFDAHFILCRSAMDECVNSCAKQRLVKWRGVTQHVMHIARALVQACHANNLFD